MVREFNVIYLYLTISANYLASTFRNDKPTLVYWSNGLFIENVNRSNLWIADKNDHTIKIITPDKKIRIVVGKSQYKSYRDGDAYNAEFNEPSALVYYNSSFFPQNKTNYYDAYYFNNSNSECIYANQFNYSSCLDFNIDLKTYSDQNNIDPYKVKLIFRAANYSNEVSSGSSLHQYVFIADSANHCIRKLDIEKAQVSTYSGTCGSAGFKDGPQGINRFKNPTGLGIDDDGNLYVYDSGNNYMRFIDTNGNVFTLINSACFDYKMHSSYTYIYSYIEQHLLCFRNWIKTSGKPDEHLYIRDNTQICLEHIVLCGYQSQLIFNRTKSLYDLSYYPFSDKFVKDNGNVITPNNGTNTTTANVTENGNVTNNTNSTNNSFTI